MRTASSVTDDSSLGASAGFAASADFPAPAGFASFAGSCAATLVAWPEKISSVAIALRLRNLFIISLPGLFSRFIANRTDKRQRNRLRIFIGSGHAHRMRVHSGRKRGIRAPVPRSHWAPRRQIVPRVYRVVRRLKQSELIGTVGEPLRRWILPIIGLRHDGDASGQTYPLPFQLDAQQMSWIAVLHRHIHFRQLL